MAISTIGTNSIGASQVTPAKLSQPLTSGTAVASTSGTSIDFTSIPSWVKRITVMFNGVSTSGTSNYLIQIGAGSVTSSGYVSAADQAGTRVSSTAGFILIRAITSSDLCSGTTVISTLGSNAWVATGILSPSVTTSNGFMGGVLSLGGTLDRVRITTVNGTDTFDAGSINILYE